MIFNSIHRILMSPKTLNSNIAKLGKFTLHYLLLSRDFLFATLGISIIQKTYQSMVNALAYLGGESHPILVTCDTKFGNTVKANGFRIINPLKQSIEEISDIIGGFFHRTPTSSIWQY